MFTTGLEPLVKLALRAGFRAMQRAGAGGNIAGVADLWRGREAWQKPTTKLETTMPLRERMQGGKTLGELGSGGEGVADVVLHPRHGLAARKVYAPQGLATPETIARKEQMGRAGQDPLVSQFYGSQMTPQGRGTMHFNELVAGRGAHAEPTEGSAAQRTALERTHASTQSAAQRAGFAGGAQDVRPANMVWDSHAGQYRTIDAIPTHAREFIPRDVHGNVAGTGRLPPQSAGLPEEDRRRTLHGYPGAEWLRSNEALKSPKAPINVNAVDVDPRALRRQMLDIHKMPDEHRIMAQGTPALPLNMPAASPVATRPAAVTRPASERALRRQVSAKQMFQPHEIEQALQQFGR